MLLQGRSVILAESMPRPYDNDFATEGVGSSRWGKSSQREYLERSAGALAEAGTEDVIYGS